MLKINGVQKCQTDSLLLNARVPDCVPTGCTGRVRDEFAVYCLWQLKYSSSQGTRELFLPLEQTELIYFEDWKTTCLASYADEAGKASSRAEDLRKWCIFARWIYWWRIGNWNNQTVGWIIISQACRIKFFFTMNYQSAVNLCVFQRARTLIFWLWRLCGFNAFSANFQGRREGNFEKSETVTDVCIYLLFLQFQYAHNCILFEQLLWK